MAVDVAYFCPDCMSPRVTYSSLAGGAASCQSCDWKGQKEQMTAHQFENNAGSPEEIVRVFGRQLLLCMAQHMALPLGKMLKDFGFLDHTKELERYLRVSAAATLQALFVERVKIEEEKRKNAS